MGKGAWTLFIALLALFGAALYVGFVGWTTHSDVEMPTYVYVMMFVGIGFTLLIGCGLMALLFYSHHKGYDDDAQGEIK
ncbi:MAG: hypothetical protein J0H17_01735 [Rhizobiales bacterium]|jgi:hypothetical protein|nr:hypothetical protein [Hyphomicrobiales bacterium]